MSWRTVLEADLRTVLDADELRAYRQKATTQSGTDPVPALIENAVQEARDRIRAHEPNELAAGSTVPEGMIARVLVIIRYRVLTICKPDVGEDRRTEYNAAEKYFRDVADGKVSVPQPEGEVSDETPPKRPKPRYNKRCIQPRI
ncbi:MAG: phage protein Gp36 family protein [Verrucomicrobiota bacterium]